jgi:hypothetical protein
MCGDFDDHERIDEELFERFVEQAKTFGVAPPGGTDPAAPRLDSQEERLAYMQGLFTAGLSRCLNDAAGLPPGERMDALAGQAIVFSRLAGFLAAQFPPDADQFRTVISAVVDAHRETVAAQ